MDVIPIPELLVASAIAVIVFGVRTVWRCVRAPAAISRSEREFEWSEQTRAKLLASCIALALLSIPHILRIIPPNGLFGLRIRETMSNPAVWYPANAFMGWVMLLTAAASATLLLLLPSGIKRWWLWAAFLAPVAGALVASLLHVGRLS